MGVAPTNNLDVRLRVRWIDHHERLQSESWLFAYQMFLSLLFIGSSRAGPPSCSFDCPWRNKNPTTDVLFRFYSCDWRTPTFSSLVYSGEYIRQNSLCSPSMCCQRAFWPNDQKKDRIPGDLIRMPIHAIGLLYFSSRDIFCCHCSNGAHAARFFPLSVGKLVWRWCAPKVNLLWHLWFFSRSFVLPFFRLLL